MTSIKTGHVLGRLDGKLVETHSPLRQAEHLRNPAWPIRTEKDTNEQPEVVTHIKFNPSSPVWGRP